MGDNPFDIFAADFKAAIPAPATSAPAFMAPKESRGPVSVMRTQSPMSSQMPQQPQFVGSMGMNSGMGSGGMVGGMGGNGMNVNRGMSGVGMSVNGGMAMNGGGGYGAAPNQPPQQWGMPQQQQLHTHHQFGASMTPLQPNLGGGMQQHHMQGSMTSGDQQVNHGAMVPSNQQSNPYSSMLAGPFTSGQYGSHSQGPPPSQRPPIAPQESVSSLFGVPSQQQISHNTHQQQHHQTQHHVQSSGASVGGGSVFSLGSAPQRVHPPSQINAPTFVAPPSPGGMYRNPSTGALPPAPSFAPPAGLPFGPPPNQDGMHRNSFIGTLPPAPSFAPPAGLPFGPPPNQDGMHRSSFIGSSTSVPPTSPLVAPLADNDLGGLFGPVAPAPAPPTYDDPWGPPPNSSASTVPLADPNAGALVASTIPDDDPFGIFGSKPKPAPVAAAPVAPAPAVIESDDPWADMGFGPPVATSAAVVSDAAPKSEVVSTSGGDSYVGDEQQQPSNVPPPSKDRQEGELPPGGEWYDARIFTPTLGVMFFKPQELTDSLFLQTDRSTVDALDDRPVVAFIVEGSSARSAGVELGHVLLKVNGIDVKNPKEASRLIKEGPRPLPLLFYVPDTTVVVAEGEHMVKYDTRETVAPNSAKDWKPKYVVIGGIIAQPWMMNMYRSKSEYDIAVIETQARRPVSVKVKQFSLQSARIQNDWQGPQMVKYKNKLHPWKYIVVLPVSRNPIKISSPNLTSLKPVHEGIRRVLMAQQRDRGHPGSHSAAPVRQVDPYGGRSSDNYSRDGPNDQYRSAPSGGSVQGSQYGHTPSGAGTVRRRVEY